VDRKSLTLFLVGSVIVALGLAFFVSPLASNSPDGLEKVSIDQGFDGDEQGHELADGPFADYRVRGVHDDGLGRGLAGAVGVAVTLGVGLLLFATIRAIRRRRDGAPPTLA